MLWPLGSSVISHQTKLLIDQSTYSLRLGFISIVSIRKACAVRFSIGCVRCAFVAGTVQEHIFGEDRMMTKVPRYLIATIAALLFVPPSVVRTQEPAATPGPTAPRPPRAPRPDKP